MKNTRPSSYDVHLCHQGNHFYSYQFMGAHLVQEKSRAVIDKDVRVAQSRQIRGEENKPVVIAKKMVV